MAKKQNYFLNIQLYTFIPALKNQLYYPELHEMDECSYDFQSVFRVVVTFFINNFHITRRFLKISGFLSTYFH